MKFNRKNKLLILSFLLALFICYAFAISNTIVSYDSYKSKIGLILENNNSPKTTHELLLKERELDLLLSNYNISDSESFQNDLLKQLNIYSKSYDLKIIDFQQPHIIAEKGYVATSYIFSLEGSFNGCLALLNKIENNGSLGSIKHLNFVKKRNYKTNVDQLFVEVIMQKNRGT
jgi:hypothetical protein